MCKLRKFHYTLRIYISDLSLLSHIQGSLTQVAQTLATSYRVVVPDLPRHGSQFAIALTDASAIATVRRTIEEAVPGGRAVVLGWSMGGWVALSFARRHPEMCLAVMAGGCYLDPTQASFAAMATKMKSNVSE